MIFSDKQKKFLNECTAAYNLAHGAVRSGKTICTLEAWGRYCYRCPDSDLIMVGHSIETIYYNAIMPFMDMFKGYCVWQPGNHILKFCDKKIRVMGASDQGAVSKIQGPTISGGYGDEMTLFPKNFTDMFMSRFSKPHSQYFATMNPEGPNHYIKTDYIDKADGKDIYELHFNLEDNPHLGDSYKNRVKKLYSGLWYRRYINGEWCQAEGAVFDMFDTKRHVTKRAPTYAKQYIVGIDYGTTNPFACLLIGINGDNPGAKIWVEKEYYWNPKQTGRQKTDSEFVIDMVNLLEPYNVSMCFVDPNAASLKVEMRKNGLKVRDANNDVLNGIRTVSNFLAGGDLAICECCPNLVKEMESYRWNPKKEKIGEDEPIKEFDHACDALRYAIHTQFGHHKNIPKSPILKPLPSRGWENTGTPTDFMSGGAFGR